MYLEGEAMVTLNKLLLLQDEGLLPPPPIVSRTMPPSPAAGGPEDEAVEELLRLSRLPPALSGLGDTGINDEAPVSPHLLRPCRGLSEFS